MTLSDLTDVESSFIAAVGHDAAERALVVRMASGRTYRYRGVGAEVFAQMLDAESKGEFYNAHIKRNYAEERVTWNGHAWEVVA